MKACWHCQGQGSCDCIVCAEDGRCLACVAVAAYREPTVDPREAQWWILVRPEAPAKPYRKFIGPRRDREVAA